MKTNIVFLAAAALELVFHTSAWGAPPSTITPQSRTYVSGLGSDNNACSVSSPCRTFQAAMALTLPGGELYVLNSANYGPLTINKAMTIMSDGAVAGVLATSGAAITINAGPNDVIHLFGLDLDGGNAGTIGIQFSAGKGLNVQKTAIRGFTNSGILFAPSAGTSGLFVSETHLMNNGNNGILIAPTGSGGVNAALSRVVVSGNGLASNGVGLFAYGGGTTGAVNATITDVVANNNYYGVGVTRSPVMLRNSTVSNNAIGVRADQGAVVRIGQSTITANGTGWQATNGGQIQSYGNNNVGANGVNGTLSSTLALQ
jgi:hypothetical protein